MQTRNSISHTSAIVEPTVLEILIMGALTIITFASMFGWFGVPIKNPEYIPNAITGLTTLSGILTAFVGLRLGRQNSKSDGKLIKWIREREFAIILTLVTGLLLVAGGLTSLIYQPIDFAFKVGMLGTIFIVLATCDVMFYEALNRPAK